MKFDRSNKFDLCYYGQVNSLRLKSSIVNIFGGNIYFAGDGASFMYYERNEMNFIKYYYYRFFAVCSNKEVPEKQVFNLYISIENVFQCQNTLNRIIKSDYSCQKYFKSDY